MRSDEDGVRLAQISSWSRTGLEVIASAVRACAPPQPHDVGAV